MIKYCLDNLAFNFVDGYEMKEYKLKIKKEDERFDEISKLINIPINEVVVLLIVKKRTTHDVYNIVINFIKSGETVFSYNHIHHNKAEPSDNVINTELYVTKTFNEILKLNNNNTY